jgi:hypothetical protein
MIIGRGVRRREEFKSKLIIHAVLRCIQKILDYTIYVRGESTIRVTHEDLQLIDIMLLLNLTLQ